MSKLGCLVSDPPWQFGNTRTRAAAEDHYSTMSIRQIIRLPVEDWMADDSCLFLWVTAAHLKEGLKVMDAWGFEPKQNLIWIKTTETGRLRIGLGNYFRHAHEMCLFGTRGHFKALAHDLPTVFWAPRGEHSTKPEA